MINQGMFNLSRPSTDHSLPFPVFEYEGFFNHALYRELEAAYPEKSIFHANRGAYKSKLTASLADVTACSPIWGELYQRFSSRELIEKLYQITQRYPSERPAFQTKPWVLAPVRQPKARTLTNKIGNKLTFLSDRAADSLHNRTSVSLNFEFSWMDGECYIPPHTDLPGKLLSLMLYFPDETCCALKSDLGTEFYQAMKPGESINEWSSTPLEGKTYSRFIETHDIFFKSQFSPNKLVGFIKNSISWHGMNKVELPQGVRRRSLNINYYLR